MATDNDGSSLVDKVVTVTRRRILSGEYPPGTRLRIRTLARDSGVSTIPVREALRILEAERLVTSAPNRGPVVSGLSISDLNDLYDLRINLEPLALSSTKRLTDDETATLVGLLEEMEEARLADQAETVIDLHRRFHFFLYDRTESTWLPHLIALLWNHAERYQWLSIEPRNPEASAEHMAMVRAMQAGNVESAADTLRAHLETTRKLLEDVYAESPDDADMTSRVAS